MRVQKAVVVTASSNPPMISNALAVATCLLRIAALLQTSHTKTDRNTGSHHNICISSSGRGGGAAGGGGIADSRSLTIAQ